MKAVWMLLLLVIGVLFFVIGAAMDLAMIEGFGAVVLIPGPIGLLGKILLEEEVRGYNK